MKFEKQVEEAKKKKLQNRIIRDITFIIIGITFLIISIVVAANEDKNKEVPKDNDIKTAEKK